MERDLDIRLKAKRISTVENPYPWGIPDPNKVGIKDDFKFGYAAHALGATGAQYSLDSIMEDGRTQMEAMEGEIRPLGDLQAGGATGLQPHHWEAYSEALRYLPMWLGAVLQAHNEGLPVKNKNEYRTRQNLPTIISRLITLISKAKTLPMDQRDLLLGYCRAGSVAHMSEITGIPQRTLHRRLLKIIDPIPTLWYSKK